MARFRTVGLRVLTGGMAGLVAYTILLVPDTPWEESVAAGLIGLVPGLVRSDRRLALFGSLACIVGWLAGTLLFGVVIMLGVGAWILAGGALGVAAGIHGRSLPRAIFGMFLGALAGLMSEAARFLTVLTEAFRYCDMQLLLLVSAGILLPLATYLATGLGGRECTRS
jgi:hypothetical protein